MPKYFKTIQKLNFKNREEKQRRKIDNYIKPFYYIIAD